MKKLPKGFLIGWYTATALYAAFLVVAFPLAIRSLALYAMTMQVAISIGVGYIE